MLAAAAAADGWKGVLLSPSEEAMSPCIMPAGRWLNVAPAGEHLHGRETPFWEVCNMLQCSWKGCTCV